MLERSLICSSAVGKFWKKKMSNTFQYTIEPGDSTLTAKIVLQVQYMFMPQLCINDVSCSDQV